MPVEPVREPTGEAESQRFTSDPETVAESLEDDLEDDLVIPLEPARNGW